MTRGALWEMRQYRAGNCGDHWMLHRWLFCWPPGRPVDPRVRTEPFFPPEQEFWSASLTGVCGSTRFKILLSWETCGRRGCAPQFGHGTMPHGRHLWDPWSLDSICFLAPSRAPHRGWKLMAPFQSSHLHRTSFPSRDRPFPPLPWDFCTEGEDLDRKLDTSRTLQILGADLGSYGVQTLEPVVISPMANSTVESWPSRQLMLRSWWRRASEKVEHK